MSPITVRFSQSEPLIRKPNEDQKQALNAVYDWYHESAEQEFKLGGLAGTGKSFIAPLIPSELGLDPQTVHYCAFTNKATSILALNLGLSGVDSPVTTISKFLHQAKEIHCKSCPVATCSTGYAVCHGNANSHCGCNLFFTLKNVSEIPALVVCDESSMISDELYDDLLSVAPGLKILFIGDHGQLPPVGHDVSILEKCDYVLEEIVRQAKESPIIKLAYQARSTGHVDYGDYGGGVRKVSFAELEQDENLIDESFQAICWHRTSKQYDVRDKGVASWNKLFRSSFGRGQLPEEGDKVVSVRVNRKHQIPKGTIGYIKSIDYVDSRFHWAAIDVPGQERPYVGNISAMQFNKPEPIWGQEKLDLWNYGYCLTCHEAQGSEFDNVVVFEPSEYWRGSAKIDYKRWFYTAITRAKSRLIIVG